MNDSDNSLELDAEESQVWRAAKIGFLQWLILATMVPLVFWHCSDGARLIRLLAYGGITAVLMIWLLARATAAGSFVSLEYDVSRKIVSDTGKGTIIVGALCGISRIYFPSVYADIPMTIIALAVCANFYAFAFAMRASFMNTDDEEEEQSTSRETK